MSLNITSGIRARVHEDLLDMRVFLRDVGGVFVRWWRTYDDYIREHRGRMSAPRFYIEFEWLYG